MRDITDQAQDQIRRLNARIAQVAADYNQCEFKQRLCLKAGDIRRARQVRQRLHCLKSELAYLAGQLTQCDRIQLDAGHD